MRVQVRKWGNSLALRIPKPSAEDADIREGSVVDVFVDDGRLVAVPVAPNSVRLEDLLKRVTKRNTHKEADLGGSVGKEAW